MMVMNLLTLDQTVKQRMRPKMGVNCSLHETAKDGFIMELLGHPQQIQRVMSINTLLQGAYIIGARRKTRVKHQAEAEVGNPYFKARHVLG